MRLPTASRPRQVGALVLAAVVAGVTAGLIGIAMALLLEGFETLFYGDLSTMAAGGGRVELAQRVAAAPAWRRVLAPATAGLIAGALWWWERSRGGVISVEQVVADAAAPARPLPRHEPGTGRQDASGHNPAEHSTAEPASPSEPPASSTPSAHEPGPTDPATALGPRAARMGILRPFADAVLQVLTVGGGNSVGREGAPRLAAGAVATALALRLHLHRDWAGPLIASAAGAGLAAMYNAPLGGAAYAVEIVMLTGTRRRGTWLAVPISLIATAVAGLHSHFRPSVPIPATAANPATLAACLLIMPVAAAAGWTAKQLWGWCKRHCSPGAWRLPLGIGAAGLATGVASLWLPILPGNGRDALAAALVSPTTLAALAPMLGVIALKPVLTGLTLGAGATGGLLAPSFSLGSCTGATLAIILAAAGAPVSVPALALLGAGVTLAVTQNAPVFAALFVWEVVHGPVWTLPVLLAACLAATRSRAGLAWVRERRRH